MAMEATAEVMRGMEAAMEVMEAMDQAVDITAAVADIGPRAIIDLMFLLPFQY